MKNLVRKHLKGLILLGLAVCLSSLGVRGQPESESNPGLGQCSELTGQLRGLCTAYFAQGCGNQVELSLSCRIIEENFVDAGGSPVHLKPGCPCDFSTENLDRFFGNQELFCFDLDEPYAKGNAVQNEETSSAIAEIRNAFNTPPGMSYPVCGLIPLYPGTAEQYLQDLLFDQAEDCYQRLADYIAFNGLVCF